jgi:hypothetical protein
MRMRETTQQFLEDIENEMTLEEIVNHYDLTIDKVENDIEENEIRFFESDKHFLEWYFDKDSVEDAIEIVLRTMRDKEYIPFKDDERIIQLNNGKFIFRFE